MAGQHNAFGALSFKRVLRNYILGCGEVVPQPKNAPVRPDEEDDGKSGFEDCTADLVQSQKTKVGNICFLSPFVLSKWEERKNRYFPPKGKVIVSTVIDGDAEMMDFSDMADLAETEPIHFETEIDDPEFDTFLEQCGMSKH